MTKQRSYNAINLLVSLTLLALLVLAFMPQKALADTATRRPGGAGDEANLTVVGATNNWEVDMEDECSFTEDCTLTTGNLTWIGSSGFFNCSSVIVSPLNQSLKD